MATFQAKYDYSSNAPGMLSFRNGDKFVVKNRTNDDWWTVEDSKGEMGLVPVSYLEAMPTPPKTQAQNGVGGEGEVYVTLYDFTGQNSTQLTFKQGEKLWLLTKTDPSWWTMRSPSGATGLVPINYIDKADIAATSGSHGNSEPHPQGNEALSEVLLSIDRAMQKIHDEAVVQGGMYTAEQRSALQQLTAHRKSVVESNNPTTPSTSTLTPSPTTQSHTPSSTSTPSPSHTSTKPPQASTTPKHTHDSPSAIATQSPRPRRRAPPPPASAAQKKDYRKSMPAGSMTAIQGGGRGRKDSPGGSPRQSGNLRSSKENLLTDYQSQTLPLRDSKKRDRSYTQPQFTAGEREKSRSHTQISQNHVGTVSQSPAEQHRQKARVQAVNSNPLPPHHRSSETLLNGRVSSFSTFSSQPSQPSRATSSPSKASFGRRFSEDVHVHHHPSFTPSSAGSSPRMGRRSASTDALGDNQKLLKALAPGPSPGLSPKGSPMAQRRQRSSSSRSITSLPEHPAHLPTQFSASDGAELVEVVRSRTNLTYAKSLQAVAGVLEVIKNKVPQCMEMVDGLLSAVQQSQANNSPSTSKKLDRSHDMERLKEIFFQLQDVRDDSQQRGWAVHDDQEAIMEYLRELLQILCDADPSVTKNAVQEDKYENILTLIGYYDIESRTPIRLLMLQIFGVLCGLDKAIISVLLTSILPNELGRDIQDNLTEIEKTLYSCTVCTMIFSTGEAIPLSIYDQWSEGYIGFLLDTIESPPEEDTEDQVADAFLNVILSYNQHFQDPETNLVMKALREKSNPRNFSEKFMFLINRGEDPVVLNEPCCPDSLTKFALDIFSSKDTSGMFYTTDLKVLIDIVLRQISDLCPGDETRTHFLELLYRIVHTTDYRAHDHKRKEITAVLARIAQEESAESLRDHDVIKKLWVDHTGCFDEVTDV